MWTASVGALFVGLLWLLGSTGEPAYAGRPLHVWVRAWLTGGFRERVEAREALAGVGPEALPALIGMLESRETGWGATVRRRLNALWPGRFLSPLPASGLHSVAAQLLRQLGPRAVPATPALVRLLDASRFPAATTAHDTLVKLGEPALPAVLKGLRASSPGVVSNAATVLDEMLPGARLRPVVPALVRAAETAPPEARAGLARPLLRAAAADLDPAARRVVARLADTADPVVLRVLLEQDVALRGPSVFSEELLRRCLEHPDFTVRLRAAESLWWSGVDRSAGLGALTNLLAEPTHTWEAALALGRMGPEAAAAIPALVAAVRCEPAHRPDRTPAASAMALARMGEAALPGLLELLEDPELDVRFSAAQALRELGPRAAPAVPALVRLLQVRQPRAEVVAALALGAIGPAAAPAAPELRRIAANRAGYPQAAAQEALTRIGLPPDAEQASLGPDVSLPGLKDDRALQP